MSGTHYEAVFNDMFDEGVSLDADSGVIVGCRLCGRRSANGYVFSETPNAFAKAGELYEGTAVYLGHDRTVKHPNERPLDKIAGVVRNVRLDNEGLPRGDLHTQEAPQGESLRKLIRSGLKGLSLSHVASYTFKAGDRSVVESVDSVWSTDIVRGAATTKSLYESQDTETKEEEMELKNRIKELEAAVESLKDSLLTAERQKAELAVELATIKAPKSRSEGFIQGAKERTEIRRKPWSVEDALNADDLFKRSGQDYSPQHVGFGG